jgi:CheY-like chemotaxis protein
MKKAVLIVDDDETIRTVLAMLLEELECGVESADGVLQAIGMVDGKRYDLIFTDYEMPGMNGLELIRILREKSPHSVVVLMTGSASGDLLHDSNADGYLQKPFTADELRMSLSRALRRAGRDDGAGMEGGD